jgi:hypothetical protein
MKTKSGECEEDDEGSDEEHLGGRGNQLACKAWHRELRNVWGAHLAGEGELHGLDLKDGGAGSRATGDNNSEPE